MLRYSQKRDGVLYSKCWCTPQRFLEYSSTSIQISCHRHAQQPPTKPANHKSRGIVYAPGNVGVLPNKGRCTPQQILVYSATRDGVLPSKCWCTPQRFLVYS